MGFALKLNFLDVVVSDSLKHYYVNGKKMGYQFQIRLNYYRGHFLSVIDEFAVRLDGQAVPEEHIRFCIHGKEFSPVEFDKCYTEFWQITEPAAIRVYAPGGIDEGEHNVDVTLIFRSPYMAIGPDHQYMPVDSCGSKFADHHRLGGNKNGEYKDRNYLILIGNAVCARGA